MSERKIGHPERLFANFKRKVKRKKLARDFFLENKIQANEKKVGERAYFA